MVEGKPFLTQRVFRGAAYSRPARRRGRLTTRTRRGAASQIAIEETALHATASEKATS